MAFRILLALLFTTSAHAADLKVLSWNVYMLPKPIKKSLQKTRAKVISEQLKNNDYELMFFQEAFMGTIRDELRKVHGAKFPHTYYLKNSGKVKHVFGSGLFIMSRYPFKVLDKVYFKSCAAFDCYASKGSVLIETTLPSGKVVQFAPTHLQSKESEGAKRLAQLQQIKTMLLKYQRPQVLQIILGDLNIDVIEPEFTAGLRITEMSATPLVGPIKNTNGLENECYKNPGQNREWIDHVWVTQSLTNNLSTMQVRPFVFQHKGKTCPSSDHHAVEAEIYL